ncbi:hypothetical protein TGAMA5MH_02680 [Trichoderma gamsii]|uniref:Uncharacterized protein n=1 Tax=Trichoderma gamsii TaxID=398673 RepID=A0A2K0TIY4_9HYPO|nr:hypothetical protein TGAMA5MH_02680 [Trichoderma gamsii]
MTAYSAAFLVKLLLSAPDIIVQEIEYTVVDTIRATALAFSQTGAATGTSCELQSRFLNNIAIKLSQRKKKDAPPMPNLSNADNYPAANQNELDSTRLSFLPLATSQSVPQPFEQPNPDVFIFHPADLDPFFTDDCAWADIMSSTVFNTQNNAILA